MVMMITVCDYIGYEVIAGIQNCFLSLFFLYFFCFHCKSQLFVVNYVVRLSKPSFMKGLGPQQFCFFLVVKQFINDFNQRMILRDILRALFILDILFLPSVEEEQFNFSLVVRITFTSQYSKSFYLLTQKHKESYVLSGSLNFQFDGFIMVLSGGSYLLLGLKWSKPSKNKVMRRGKEILPVGH